MRLDTAEWTVATAVKAGHYHLYKGANCQDAAEFFVADDIICGIGCDGCGEGDYSEVGARMLCVHALSEAARLHQMGFPAERIVDNLFFGLVRYIEQQIFYLSSIMGASPSPDQIAHYVKHHWLATIMGFIIQEDKDGVIFSCGDGIYGLDDQEIIIDQGNKPTYIAYQALKEPEIVGVQPENIPVQFVKHRFDAATVSRLFIASDGFEHHNEQKLALSRDRQPDLPTSLHGEQWGKKGKFGLKKWMNSRSDRGYFDDDCFIITAERLRAKSDIP